MNKQVGQIFNLPESNLQNCSTSEQKIKGSSNEKKRQKKICM